MVGAYGRPYMTLAVYRIHWTRNHAQTEIPDDKSALLSTYIVYFMVTIQCISDTFDGHAHSGCEN